jgi:hypothetical protein
MMMKQARPSISLGLSYLYKKQQIKKTQIAPTIFPTCPKPIQIIYIFLILKLGIMYAVI